MIPSRLPVDVFSELPTRSMSHLVSSLPPSDFSFVMFASLTVVTPLILPRLQLCPFATLLRLAACIRTRPASPHAVASLIDRGCGRLAEAGERGFGHHHDQGRKQGESTIRTRKQSPEGNIPRTSPPQNRSSVASPLVAQSPISIFPDQTIRHASSKPAPCRSASRLDAFRRLFGQRRGECRRRFIAMASWSCPICAETGRPESWSDKVGDLTAARTGLCS